MPLKLERRAADRVHMIRRIVLVLAVVVGVAVGGPAGAFHSGGTGECTGCHSMHGAKAGGSSLLVGTDPSSTCLTCHEQTGTGGPTTYQVSTAASDMPTGTAPRQRTPGGDFGWLKKTYTFTAGGVPTIDAGERNGHNVIAFDNGYVADATNATAPGGTFPAAQLACTSCHDPHSPYRRQANGAIVKTGKPVKASGSYNAADNDGEGSDGVGVYRLLAGNGYARGGVTFAGVPAAKAPVVYNQSEATSQVRVAYGVATATNATTWSSWCTTCHATMQASGSVHPSDHALGATIAGNYNSYVTSANLTGTAATSFTSLVPFATNTGDYAVLAGLASSDAATSAGPQSSDQVMCLSCHRAHASGWPYAMRWSSKSSFITAGGEYPGTDASGADARAYARGRTRAEVQASYYDRPASLFASYQRGLCNKCHAND